MMAMTVYISRDESYLDLRHFGIKGMKWGIRKDGMPQGWQGRKRGSRSSQKSRKGSVKDSAKRFYHKHEKAIKIGAAAVAAAATTYAAYKGYQFDHEINGDFNIINGNFPQTLAVRASNMATVAAHGDIFKAKGSGFTPEADQKTVNPFFDKAMDEFKRGSEGHNVRYEYSKATTNCASCSATYDLRRRGFDVSANRTENLSRMDRNISEYYPGAKTSKYYGLDKLNSELGKMPEGARGTLAGQTVHGTGHSIAWEKTKSGVVYRDCQTNETYSPSTIKEIYHDTKNSTGGPNLDSGVAYTRLDNCTPDLSKFYKRGIVSKPGENLSEYDKASNMVRDTRGWTDSFLPTADPANKLVYKLYSSKLQRAYLEDALRRSGKL